MLIYRAGKALGSSALVRYIVDWLCSRQSLLTRLPDLNSYALSVVLHR